MPGCGACLGIDVDYSACQASRLSGASQVQSQRSFSRAALLTEKSNRLHSMPILVSRAATRQAIKALCHIAGNTAYLEAAPSAKSKSSAELLILCIGMAFSGKLRPALNHYLVVAS
jgi:hypothetical protein